MLERKKDIVDAESINAALKTIVISEKYGDDNKVN